MFLKAGFELVQLVYFYFESYMLYRGILNICLWSFLATAAGSILKCKRKLDRRSKRDKTGLDYF